MASKGGMQQEIAFEVPQLTARGAKATLRSVAVSDTLLNRVIAVVTITNAFGRGDA